MSNISREEVVSLLESLQQDKKEIERDIACIKKALTHETDILIEVRERVNRLKKSGKLRTAYPGLHKAPSGRF